MKQNFIILLFLLFFSQLSTAQWTPIPSGTSYDIYDIQFIDQNIGFYVGTGLYKTTDGGNTWNKLKFLQSDSTYYNGCVFFGVYFLDENNGYIAGAVFWDNTDIILKTTDGGVSWTMSYRGTNMTGDKINDIIFIDSNHGIAVGTNGRILETSDAGANWQLRNSGTTKELKEIDDFTYNNYLAVGDSVIVKRLSSTGGNWVLETFPYNFESVYCLSTSEAYVAGYNGIVMKTTDISNTWTIIDTHTNLDFSDIYFTSQDTGYIASQNGKIIQTQDAGNLWEQYNGNDMLFAIAFANQNIGIAAGLNGFMIRTDNMGGGYLPISSFYTNETTFCVDSLIPFLNNTSQSYTFEWFLNDSLVATTFDADFVFTNGDSYDTVSLVVYNSTGSDTSNMVIHTEPSLDINLNTVALDDTVCPNGSTSVCVLNSEIGVTYKFYDGTALQGVQYGNGYPLYFNTYNIPTTKTFNVVAIKSSVCGTNTDTNHITIYTVPIITDLNIAASIDSICKNDSVEITVFNTNPTSYYQLYKNGYYISDTVYGNNGTIHFNTQALSNTANFSIKVVNQYGCYDFLDTSLTIYVDNFNLTYNFQSNYFFVGDTTNIDNNSTADTYLWSSDTTVYISNDTAYEPYLIFNQYGYKQIKLYGMTNFGCIDSSTKTVGVYTHPNFSNGSYCFFDTLGNSSQYNVLDMKVDKYGNTYVGGFYYTSYGINGKYVYFVSKYSPTGDLIWKNTKDPFSIPGSYYNYQSSFVNGLVVDDDQNVYICGNYTTNYFIIDSIEIYHNYSAGQYDPKYVQFYIAKLDSNGVCQWIIHSNTQDIKPLGASDILLLHNGNLLVSVYRPFQAFFPNGTSHGFSEKVTMMQINTDGHYINSFPIDYNVSYNQGINCLYNPSWSAWYDSKIAVVGPKLFQNANGKIYVFGESTNGLNFGNIQLNSSVSGTKVFKAVLDINNGWENVTTLYGRSDGCSLFKRTRIPVFSVDENDNIYSSVTTCSGWDSTIVYFNNGNSISGHDKCFINKFDANGNKLWTNSADNYDIKEIEAANSNEIYLFGEFNDFLGISSQDSASVGLVSKQWTDVAISLIDGNGNINWVDFLGSNSSDYAMASTKNNCEQIYFSNIFYDTVYTNYGSTGKKSYNLFLLHYGPNQNCQDSCFITTPIENIKNTENNIIVYPNPVENYVYFKIPENEEIIEIKIFNISGQKIITKTNTKFLNVNKLAHGIYFVDIITNKNNYYSKFIKN